MGKIIAHQDVGLAQGREWHDEAMGIFSSRPAPQYTAVAAARTIACLHCESTQFWQRRAKLNSAASEFFDVAWASEESLVLTCTTCGSMREFLPRAVQLTEAR